MASWGACDIKEDRGTSGLYEHRREEMEKHGLSRTWRGPNITSTMESSLDSGSRAPIQRWKCARRIRTCRCGAWMLRVATKTTKRSAPNVHSNSQAACVNTFNDTTHATSLLLILDRRGANEAPPCTSSCPTTTTTRYTSGSAGFVFQLLLDLRIPIHQT